MKKTNLTKTVVLLAALSTAFFSYGQVKVDPNNSVGVNDCPCQYDVINIAD